MGLVNPAMPAVGTDPRGIGESTLNNGLTSLLNEFNGNIESANLKDNSVTITDQVAGANGPATGSFSAYRAAAVSLATGAVVVFDTEEWDVSSWFDVTTGRFTPQVAGYYRLSWAVRANTALAADVFWIATLRKNAAAAKNGNMAWQRGTVTINSVGSTPVVANGTTDFFDVMISHSVGAATAIAPNAADTFFQGELVGRS